MVEKIINNDSENSLIASPPTSQETYPYSLKSLSPLPYRSRESVFRPSRLYHIDGIPFEPDG